MLSRKADAASGVGMFRDAVGLFAGNFQHSPRMERI
jgi:hypothetical protein